MRAARQARVAGPGGGAQRGRGSCAWVATHRAESAGALREAAPGGSSGRAQGPEAAARPSAACQRLRRLRRQGCCAQALGGAERGGLEAAIEHYHKALGLRPEDTFTAEMLTAALRAAAEMEDPAAL
jgi:hypothetical protein